MSIASTENTNRVLQIAQALQLTLVLMCEGTKYKGKVKQFHYVPVLDGGNFILHQKDNSSVILDSRKVNAVNFVKRSEWFDNLMAETRISTADLAVFYPDYFRHNVRLSFFYKDAGRLCRIDEGTKLKLSKDGDWMILLWQLEKDGEVEDGFRAFKLHRIHDLEIYLDL